MATPDNDKKQVDQYFFNDPEMGQRCAERVRQATEADEKNQKKRRKSKRKAEER